MWTVRALANLIRLDSSLLAFLSVFVPVLSRTKDWTESLSKALPILFVGICTFVANDLDDLERDKLNHPERPLPSGKISPTFAAIIYFTCLGVALFTIKFCIATKVGYLYYTFLILVISYNYLVEYLPGCKPFYVAAVSSLPILIVTKFFPHDQLQLVVFSVFFLVLGRELFMDFLDREGDIESFIHKIDAQGLTALAFSLQGIGLVLLSMLIDELRDLGVLSVMASVYFLCLHRWRRSPKEAIRLMKLPLFIGLYFLT